MMKAPIPIDDEERLKDLYSYQILDTAEEKIFNTVVSLASSICNVPISSISLIDRDRQWFKAKIGLDRIESARDAAFCSHTIMSNEVFEIYDATLDERFVENPFVTGDPYIRSYTGVPLVSEKGHRLGSLCVIDSKPGRLSQQQKKHLQELSDIVIALMEAKKKTLFDMSEKQNMTEKLSSLNTELNNKLGELGLNNRRLSQVGDMIGMLQSCQSNEEACNVIQQYCIDLFPHANGHVYFIEAQREYLELAASWGAHNDVQKVLFFEDCWSLRRGHIYSHDKSGTVKCRHLELLNAEYTTMCSALMAQGEVLGLLTLVFEETPSNSEKMISAAIGEQISIALANIRLRNILKVDSTHDPLTKLYNRRYLTDVFRSEISKALRSEEKLIISLIDIDYFKKFNDTFGHDAGDFVLQVVAEQMNLSCESRGIPFRLGGEEFVVLYRGMTVDEALKQSELLRQKIESLVLEYQSKKLGVLTISQGVAIFPDHAKSLNALLKVADDALYSAKKTGRNKVVTFDPHPLK